MELATFAKLFKETLLAGLILFDRTGAFRDPADKEPAARYDTGQRVEVVQERILGERFYQVKAGTETLWVPAKAVFLLGDRPDSDSLPLDFYRRASKNKNDEARALGAGGMMRLLEDRKLLAAWKKFQRDPSDEVRCAANEVFSLRSVKEDARFHADLTDALLRVNREGGWHERALCGLGEVLSRSSHPDKAELQFLLAARGLGDEPAREPDRTKTRKLLKQGLRHPEAWVRRNLVSQLCGEGVSDQAVGVLTELFPSMSPEDKAAVIENDYYLNEKESAKPLIRMILGLIEDKSQPTQLRLLVAEDWSLPHVEKKRGIYNVLSDPHDDFRIELAARFCRHRDVLEEAANRGDDAVFGTSLLCLDRMLAHRAGPYAFEYRAEEEGSFKEWLAPDLAAGLESVIEAARREQLETRLKCLTGESICPVSFSALTP
ncbi:MAG: hypothetical protein WC728_04345 [Elusimicrobiota bacterium]